MLDQHAQKCRVCGVNSLFLKTERTIRNYHLSNCAFCGTAMVERQPSIDELRRIYDSFFEKGEYERHRVEFGMIRSGKMPPNFYRRCLLKRAERICDGRKLIEIGGGTGSFGVSAISRGWEYMNYDISEVAINFCRQLSLDARLFSIGDLPPLLQQSADVIVMWEVIEHIWNLHEYLDVVRGALRSKGVFLFSTPNYLSPSLQETDAWGPLSSPPIHVTFFTKESLEKVLHICGFEITSIFKKRIYRPHWTFSSIIKSLGYAFCLIEPDSLYGIARKG